MCVCVTVSATMVLVLNVRQENRFIIINNYFCLSLESLKSIHFIVGELLDHGNCSIGNIIGSIVEQRNTLVQFSAILQAEFQ